MDEEFYRKQRELMTETIREMDVVITTAAVPGKRAPVLVTKEMVDVMKPGAVVVDLGAERGGNCELTKAGETVLVNGVHIIGPVNVPASMAFDASQLYSKNITTLLGALVSDKELVINTADEIISASVVTHDGGVPNAQTRANIGLEE
jgi:NAD(P) transhydrogenase subunit alpha